MYPAASSAAAYESARLLRSRVRDPHRRCRAVSLDAGHLGGAALEDGDLRRPVVRDGDVLADGDLVALLVRHGDAAVLEVDVAAEGLFGGLLGRLLRGLSAAGDGGDDREGCCERGDGGAGTDAGHGCLLGWSQSRAADGANPSHDPAIHPTCQRARLAGGICHQSAWTSGNMGVAGPCCLPRRQGPAHARWVALVPRVFAPLNPAPSLGRLEQARSALARAPGGIRTHTGRCLRPLPLPVGIPGRVAKVSRSGASS